MTDLSIRIEGRAGRVTFTRPQALNALSYDMCKALDAALIAWRDDPAVALVVIDAEGDRAFCPAAISPNFTPKASAAITPMGSASGAMNIA